MKHTPTFALLVMALWPMERAVAQLPILGGAYGQTLRFVIAAGDPIPTESGGCSALVRLISRDLLPAAERRFDLRAGQSAFLEVNLNSLTDRFRRRADLLPAVSEVRGSCYAATEVYENFTGRTTAYLHFGKLPSAGELLPAKPLTPVDASTGQFIRLGAARGFDPQPDPPHCRVMLGFADAAGNAVGPAKSIDLAAGGFDFVDLDPGLLLPASGAPLRFQRFVRPRLLLPASGGGDARGCAVSVQIYDQLTGWTNAAQ